MKKWLQQVSVWCVAGAMMVGVAGCSGPAGQAETTSVSAKAPVDGSYLIPNVPSYDAKVQVYFSKGPKERAQAEASILKAIREAKSSIYVQAYSFTNPNIIRALAEAPKTVKVRILLDKSNIGSRDFNKYKSILSEHGFVFTGKGERPDSIDADRYVLVDYKPAIAHNKIMIIDETLVITGSYNFTYSAEKRNAENCVFMQSPDLAKVYLENFRTRYQESQWFDKYNTNKN